MLTDQRLAACPGNRGDGLRGNRRFHCTACLQDGHYTMWTYSENDSILSTGSTAVISKLFFKSVDAMRTAWVKNATVSGKRWPRRISLYLIIWMGVTVPLAESDGWATKSLDLGPGWPDPRAFLAVHTFTRYQLSKNS